MTRTERLAQAEERARDKLDAQRKRLAQVQSAQRKEERKALQRRYLTVGKLVEQAGLFVLDEPTLARLFALLLPLTQVPAPMAVLEACLGDTEGPALEAVDGMAHPVGGVSPAC